MQKNTHMPCQCSQLAQTTHSTSTGAEAGPMVSSVDNPNPPDITTPHPTSQLIATGGLSGTAWSCLRGVPSARLLTDAHAVDVSALCKELPELLLGGAPGQVAHKHRGAHGLGLAAVDVHALLLGGRLLGGGREVAGRVLGVKGGPLTRRGTMLEGIGNGLAWVSGRGLGS